MKLPHLRVILEKLQKDIFCPRCKRPFEASEIDLVSMIDDEVELRSYCEKCDSKSSILAAVGHPPTKKKKRRSLGPNASSPSRSLSPEVIEDLSSRMKECGGDVRDIFE